MLASIAPDFLSSGWLDSGARAAGFFLVGSYSWNFARGISGSLTFYVEADKGVSQGIGVESFGDKVEIGGDYSSANTRSMSALRRDR